MAWDNVIWIYRSRARWWRTLSPDARWWIWISALVVGAIASRLAGDWSLETGSRGLPVPLYAIYSAVIAVLSGLLGSAAIAGERYRGTWDGLVLSRLTAREIILGKFAVAAWPVLLLALWTLPIWVGMFVRYAWLESDYRWTPASAVAAWVCLRALGRPLPFVAIGLYLSLRARSLLSAVTTTMGLLIALLVVLPLFSPLLSFLGVKLQAVHVAGRLLLSLLWVCGQWVLFPPVYTEYRPSFWPIARAPTSAWISIAGDTVWIVVIPLVLLGYMIWRFGRLDRKGRGDPGGRRTAGPVPDVSS